MYTRFGVVAIWSAQKASIGEVSGNLTICTGNLTLLLDKSLEIWGLYEEYEFAEAVMATYKILKSIDPIVFSCYFSSFEYYMALTLYMQTVQDWHKLLYNLAHNLGNIYDLTEEFIWRIQTAEEHMEKLFFWDRCGFIVGSLVHSVLQDPVNYYPFDPNEARKE